MSQDNFVIGADKSGLTYRTEDNAGKTAIASGHKGSTAPTYLVTGMEWIDDTSTPWVKKIYDGADWITIGTVNATTNLFTPFINGSALSLSSLWRKGADVASASALAILTDGNYFDVTGTVTVTSINTTGSTGSIVKLHFDGALILTHHATDLILPSGANITTSAGDEAEFIEYATGDFRCTSYTKADGTALISSSGSIVQDTPVATTSGSTASFTGITAEVKVIECPFVGVSTSNSTVTITLQIGDSGGLETSSYVSTSIGGFTGNTLSGAIGATSSFVVVQSGLVSSSRNFSGKVTLTREEAGSNVWILSGLLVDTTTSATFSVCGGKKTLSAELTQVQFAVSGGTFDAGSINAIYYS